MTTFTIPSTAKYIKFQIKQLDVGLSPPVFSFTLIVTLTFIMWESFTVLALILFEIWINVQYFWSSPDRQTDRQTESDAYEPTVQSAQVGSKTALVYSLLTRLVNFIICEPQWTLYRVKTLNNKEFGSNHISTPSELLPRSPNTNSWKSSNLGFKKMFRI